MSLTPGIKLGPYEILAPLGAGGMGEVYRARDTRLGREVAVKVLPEHLSANEDVRARFEREAKTVSSLNHPNICTLFDVGREGPTDYLVMELIEGETLAARLRKGPLAGPELLRIGAQVADALDRAHRAGVIHRDLKPGNIMLTRSGAKLMDFGLARAADAAKRPGSGTSGSALTQSPTVQALTTEGTIVGTYQYMAPEQLEGHEADARSDIWAMGCVLYEMATGKRAFEGRSQATLIAAIIGSQPAPVTEAPTGAPAGDAPPAGLDRLIRACLAKDPEDRVQTAHAVKQQLQWIAEGAGMSGVGVATPVPGAAAPVVVRRGAAKLAWGVAAAMTLLAAAAVAWLWPRASAPRPVYRFIVEKPAQEADAAWPRVSPDGRLLVFVGADSAGTTRAYLRPLGQTRAVPISGSEGVRRVYWSPDSKEIAFVAAGRVQRLPVTGGSPVVLCETRGGADLAWGSKGVILMDGRTNDSLLAVPAAGGELKPAARVDRASGEFGSAWPCFLPDGEHFLFVGNRQGSGGGNIRLGRLGSLDSKRLGFTDGRVEYAPGDWVIFLKGATLLAQKLDLAAGKLTGQPLTLAENIRVGNASGHFSSSASGVLAWSRGAEVPNNTLFEVDRSGRQVGNALTTGLISNPALSPEGGRILFERLPGPGLEQEILVRDLARGTEARLTFGQGLALAPKWSPDGRRYACMLERGARSTLLVGSADGLGRADTFPVPGGSNALLSQWAAAGSRLLIVPADFRNPLVFNPDSAGAVMRPLGGVSGLMAQCEISPDGRWLAYASNEGGGAVQIYVQSLTGTPGRWQVTAAGGFMPQWTRGGAEIVYETANAIMAVPIDAKESFHAGTPVRLFDTPQPLSDVNTRFWTVSADGRRFFVMKPPRLTASNPIEVVTDVRSMLNRR